MAGLNLKRLAAIRKSVEAIVDETELDEVGKSFDQLQTVVKSGGTVTMNDLTDILGDVMIEKTAAPALDRGASAATDAAPEDPLAPLFVDLYKSVFGEDGQIRKGLDGKSAQDLFQATYAKALNVFDNGLDAAVEATAIELGKGDRVRIGKGKKGHDPDCDDPDCDGDCMDDGDGDDDMKKLLKSLGRPSDPSVIKKMAAQDARIAELEHERDLAAFTKTAEEIGEGPGFAVDLLKLHRVDPKLAAGITKRLQAKNALLKQNSLWAKEIGSGEDRGSGDALSQLNAVAADLRKSGAKDDNGKALTIAKAFVEACNTHPELYSQYRQEQARR